MVLKNILFANLYLGQKLGAREVKQQDFLVVTAVTLIVWLITWFIITPFSACITVDVCVTVFTG